MGLSSWLSIDPIAIPLVSHLSSNNFWKFGKTKIGFFVIFYFNSLNPLSVASIHTNG